MNQSIFFGFDPSALACWLVDVLRGACGLGSRAFAAVPTDSPIEELT